MTYMGRYYVFPQKYGELITLSGRVVSTNLNSGIEIKTDKNQYIRLFCDDVSMNLATSQRVRTNNDYGSCKWVMHRFKRYDWCENETVCSDNINNIIKNSHIQVLINDRNMVYELTVNGKGLLNYERMTYLYREIFFISFAILFFYIFLHTFVNYFGNVLQIKALNCKRMMNSFSHAFFVCEICFCKGTSLIRYAFLLRYLLFFSLILFESLLKMYVISPIHFSNSLGASVHVNVSPAPIGMTRSQPNGTLSGMRCGCLISVMWRVFSGSP